MPTGGSIDATVQQNVSGAFYVVTAEEATFTHPNGTAFPAMGKIGSRKSRYITFPTSTHPISVAAFSLAQYNSSTSLGLYPYFLHTDTAGIQDVSYFKSTTDNNGLQEVSRDEPFIEPSARGVAGSRTLKGIGTRFVTDFVAGDFNSCSLLMQQHQKMQHKQIIAELKKLLIQTL